MPPSTLGVQSSYQPEPDNPTTSQPHNPTTPKASAGRENESESQSEATGGGGSNHPRLELRSVVLRHHRLGRRRNWRRTAWKQAPDTHCIFFGLEGGMQAARVFWEVPPTPPHRQRCYCSREGNQRQHLPNASGGVLQRDSPLQESKSRAHPVFGHVNICGKVSTAERRSLQQNGEEAALTTRKSEERVIPISPLTLPPSPAPTSSLNTPSMPPPRFPPDPTQTTRQAQR
ncbi:hypothetical protein EYF80_029692 [Liparis tanakae]|uniref:Uncharacterized protein n=1 Tax=Liparis tanakae TaxID=230148 RepID=A0A4Z2H3V5_9TELE|nr:hypothetical protein EYF80_029692 [Liparis tanakae]